MAVTPLTRRRVLLIEDEALLRSLLAQALDAAGFEVQAWGTARDAERAFAAFDPDAIVTDIDLGPGATGVDLVSSLVNQAPHLVAVIVSNYAIPPDAHQLAPAQITYLRKQDLADPADFIHALDALLRESPVPSHRTSPAGERLARLTREQLAVLRMIADGASNAQIAQRRGTSLRSAEHLVQRTFAALGLASDPAANSRVLATRIYLEAAGRPSGA